MHTHLAYLLDGCSNIFGFVILSCKNCHIGLRQRTSEWLLCLFRTGSRFHLSLSSLHHDDQYRNRQGIVTYNTHLLTNTIYLIQILRLTVKSGTQNVYSKTDKYNPKFATLTGTSYDWPATKIRFLFNRYEIYLKQERFAWTLNISILRWKSYGSSVKLN